LNTPLIDSSQVRGTPASGKTVLAKLLGQHILQEDPAVDVIFVNGWPLEEVKDLGGHWSYLQTRHGWVPGQQTVFIFDNAEMSYKDWDLWTGLFKSIHEYDDRRAIVFTSYGTPTSRIVIEGTPIYLNDSQRVTLRPVPHQDGLPPVGLLFSRLEFDDLVSKFYPSSEHVFHSSFFDAVFDITGGHVGAVWNFMSVIAAHDVGLLH
jgi:hypothetical protein